MTTPSDRPWYDDGSCRRGLEFRCTGCGHCCTGGPGYVWVTRDDIETLARGKGLDRDAFARRYVRRVERHYSLTERPDGSCVFLDEAKERCTVYDARPTQCRTYPFWPHIVDSRAAWEHEAAACPGIGEPTVVPPDEIARLRARQAANRARPGRSADA